MTARQQPLRFGLVGTGYWAQVTHAPALASTEGIEFAAVGGRNPDAARSLAATYQATAHSDMNAGLAMAFKLVQSAQDHWRMVNAPHLVALVRAGATFVNGKLVERPGEHAAEATQEAA
jgi:predicted dehydrogenase